ncbi:hypothetical protein [Vallitalea guaymasensis]|uniref:D-glucuronyl C5-epimerase C-terminal domain-containing protein n=1 Tax=Vallitalea guaymasensis TaxID=1185412 RepID=A0A8J8SAX4_9FIRM|nr:hypothetical protein [Vallitalea guaymasensis]QUH27820.1 hypothetical protein HYG85_02375 [Vallitalea guaymasensis]
MIRNVFSKIIGVILIMGIIAGAVVLVIHGFGNDTSAVSNSIEEGNESNDKLPNNESVNEDIGKILTNTVKKELSETSLKLELDLDNDDNIDYVLIFDNGSGDNIKPTVSSEKCIEHKYMNEYEYEIDLSSDYGKVLLTFHEVFDSGMIYYVEYIPNGSSSKALSFSVKAGKADSYNIFEGYYEDKTLKFNDKDIISSTILPNIINFIDGENNHIKLGRVFHEKKLERSVKTVSEIEQNINMVIDNETTYRYELPVKKGYSTKVEGVLSLKNLIIDKKVKFNIDTLIALDLANIKYVWADGVYYDNPSTYRPSAENDFFRAPCATHMRACYWVLDQGSIFTTYGISLMYSYAKLYNDKNYIPTEPRSNWIYEEYGINENFYDTRFNTDTVSSFLHMQEVYPDEKIKRVLDNYFKFYIDFVEDNSFYVDGNIFVADYMDYNGNVKMPHCSLNHMLSEMTVLYRYHLLYGDKEMFELAEKFLHSILNTKDGWIKNNGDLYYCITEEGKYKRDDYPLVTYNDLKRAEYYLKKIYGETPQEYQDILDSKEKWAKEKGYLK